jgi:DNA-3-methyladenine glycosylase
MAATLPPRCADSAVSLRRLARAELPSDATTLARYLLGKIVVHDLPAGRLSGRIVETEAYLPNDAACHAFRGPTPRNRTLFGPHGHAYVYISYGMHRMLNVTAEAAGLGSGVLLRAIEPLDGIALMQAARGTTKLTDLARGPGRLAQAMQITMGLDATDLTVAGPLWLADGPPPADIAASVRIGITKEMDRPLRFYERGSKFVSGPGKLNR